MLVACWSSKGGAGTTVVAAALRRAARPPRAERRAASPTWPATCPPRSGCPSRTAPGWPAGSRAGADVPADALGRLERAGRRRPRAAPPRATAPLDAGPGRRARRAARADAATGRRRLRHRPERRAALAVAAAATRSLLVTRPCFLSLRRALAVPLRPSEVVLCRRAGPVAHPRRRRGLRSACPWSPRSRSTRGGPGRRRRPARHPPAARRSPGSWAVLPDDGHERLVDAVHAAPARRPAPSGSPTPTACAARSAASTRCSPTPTWRAVAAAVAARATGLGPLEPLLADAAVTEVMVNGRGPVWVERAGRLARHRPPPRPRPRSTCSSSGSSARSACAPTARSPVADARLPDGSRVNVVVPPLAVDGPCITIRRFGARRDPPRRALPARAWPSCWPGRCAARANLVVSGGTGAGKTTLLNALGALLPARRAPRHRRGHGRAAPRRATTSCGSRPGPATADGAGRRRRSATSCATRCACAPTASSSARSAAPEALDMLWAMNTGHEGSLSTCHANSPVDALRRLEIMVLVGRARPAAGRGARPARLRARPRRPGRPGSRRRAPRSSPWARWSTRPAHDQRVRLLAGPGRRPRPPDAPAPPPSAPAPDPAWCR